MITSKYREKTHDANQAFVNNHVESQEDRPGTHLSCRTMARRLGVSKSSVNRMTSQGTKVKSVKRLRGVTIPAHTKVKRLTGASALLQCFPTWRVKKIAFQDEKDLTNEVPSNRQNVRIYIKGKSPKSILNDYTISLTGNRWNWWCHAAFHTGVLQSPSF